MLTLRDHQTGDLFDPWAFLGEKRRKLLEQSWAGVFRKHLLKHLNVQELSPHFAPAFGRPSKDLYVALGTLILQQLHDLTDAATVEALAFNMAWHYALDIRDEADAYLCERSLRNYRRLVIEQKLDGILFQNLTDELIRAFSVETGRQRIDSTPIRSAMRTLTRLGAVVETISKFLRELARVHPTLHQQVDQEFIRKYVDRKGEGCFASTTPSESKLRLPEAGKDLWTLVTQFQTTAASALESFLLLNRIFHEQFEMIKAKESDEVRMSLRIKEPAEIPCDNIDNPSDPDSSYNSHRGQGYAVQVMETYQEKDELNEDNPSSPDLITLVAIHKMTIHDSQCFAPALDDVESRGLMPRDVLGDTHYGSQENLRQSAERGVNVIAPAISPKGSKQNRLTLEDFELDEYGCLLQCPAGQKPLSTRVARERIQARFDRSICETCQQRNRCPVRLQYTVNRVQLRSRRFSDRSKAFISRYRWRSGIEGTTSRLKYQMNMIRLRVRGMAAVSYTVFLRALGLNILRCSRISAF